MLRRQFEASATARQQIANIAEANKQSMSSIAAMAYRESEIADRTIDLMVHQSTGDFTDNEDDTKTDTENHKLPSRPTKRPRTD
mmetsp:Transcript_11985/g.17605  ORF Transcript_11985/g.17605 Transcript_11985/m.17605 type:complete len:84 (-) Transcript_11985:59-310(-)